MKIKSTHPESQGPFVLIDDADFDPATMEAFDVAEEADAPKKRGRPFKSEATE